MFEETWAWVTIALIGAVVVVVALYMLSGLKHIKKDNDKKK